LSKHAWTKTRENDAKHAKRYPPMPQLIEIDDFWLVCCF